MEGGQDIGTTRMNQGPCIVGSQPAVPVRKLRCEARVEASPQRRCAVLPGVSQEPLQHQIEGAVIFLKCECDPISETKLI